MWEWEKPQREQNVVKVFENMGNIENNLLLTFQTNFSAFILFFENKNKFLKISWKLTFNFINVFLKVTFIFKIIVWFSFNAILNNT